MNTPSEHESQRILAEYARREREIPSDFYARYRVANLFLRHSQEKALRNALDSAGMLPLTGKRLLDLGCGEGNGLITLCEDFGIKREKIAGIELDAARADVCARRFAGADIRVGDATKLPWDAGSFDLVLQSTVFTSILDAAMKQKVASEMLRVLKPAGCVLWYDFFMNNPNNPHVRGIGRRELEQLFPGCSIQIQRVTLAPPLARRLVKLSWTLSSLLESMRFFNTHYFAVLRRNG